MSAVCPRLCLCFFLLSLIVAGCPAVLASERVTVYTEDYPPYSFLDENGTVIGEATERVVQLLQTAGIPYQMRLVPWARAYRLATTDKNALIFSLARTEERETKFDWLAPVGRPDLYLFARNDLKTPVTLSTIRSGKLTALCVESDASCGILERLGFPKKSFIYTSPEGSSEPLMVHYRRSDLYIGDRKLQPYREYLFGVEIETMHPALKVESDLVFYLAAGLHVDASLRDKVKQAYSALQAQGALVPLTAPDSSASP